MFVGRERELEALNQLYGQDRFQLFILYGRRRVGKTTLLREFCKDKPTIFFSAEQSNEKGNLDKFSELVFQYYNEEDLTPFASWDRAIRYITRKEDGEPLVLVFDEFPYLADINPSIMSVLQHLIDHSLQDSRLFVVLCGSYMGFMENEVLGTKSPLFGRRTGQLRVKPLDYIDSSLVLEGYTEEEKLLFCGALGGTPLYLGQVQKGRSFRENITALFLNSTGYLYEEPLLLLRQEVQEPGIYNAIIEAIACGASKANEIATKIGEEQAKCLKYINTLRELGIVEREIPLGEKPATRRSIYKISDFMFRFWYRYVFHNRSLLESGAQDLVWSKRIEPDISHYMGSVFENVCREYLLRKNAAGELPILFTEIGRWWGTVKAPQGGREVEIDLVAKDGDDFLFCECKWRNQPLDASILEELKENAECMPGRRGQVYYVLFSKSGFTEGLRDMATRKREILLVDMETLMTNATGRCL